MIEDWDGGRDERRTFWAKVVGSEVSSGRWAALEAKSAKGFVEVVLAKGLEPGFEVLEVENGLALDDVVVGDLEPKILSPSIGGGFDCSDTFATGGPLSSARCCIDVLCETLIPRMVRMLPAFFLQVLDLHANT